MFGIETNAREVAVKYAEMPKKITARLVATFRRIGAGMQSYILREKLRGGVLNYRTGSLGRSLFYRLWLDEPNKEAGVIIGADKTKAPGAQLHEFGGTVVPKRAANLTIPLDAARTAGGVARVTAREFIGNPGSLGFDDSFFAKSGKAIMGVRGKGKDAHVEPVFALVKQVQMPERSYLRSSVRDRREWILGELGQAVDEEVNDGLK